MPKPNLLFLATTDSYLKWASSLRKELPRSWTSDIVIVKSLQNPSKRQIRLAVGSVDDTQLDFAHILRIVAKITSSKPDAVFVGCTGPFLAVLRWMLDFTPAGRKIKLISGSPGIAFHLDGQPLRVRSNADLILVASDIEKKKLGAALDSFSSQTRLGLCRLSFLNGLDTKAKTSGPETLVFAPQPDMPKSRIDREKILIELASLKRSKPSLKVVIKLRAIDQEPQTHFEEFSYQELYESLRRINLVTGQEFVFETGSIAEQMTNKNATLITVSSTAALESLAMESPTQIIGDFDFSDEIANEVFKGSGLVARIRDYPGTSPSKPPREWLAMNYFHDPAKDNWLDEIESLVVKKRHGAFSLTPKFLSKSMFFGELLRVLFPNKFGVLLIRSLKTLVGKAA